MPTSVGPNTKGEENLVFGYDLGDVSNSYKGEPTTNLALYSDLSAGNNDGFGGTFTFNSPTLAPDGESTAYRWQSTAGVSTLGRSLTLQESTTYTVSIFVKQFPGGALTTYFLRGEPGDYVTAGSGNRTITSEWTRISWTFTTSAGSTGTHRVGANVQSAGDAGFYYYGIQIEAKDHATQYLPTGASTATRSATQGLQDLTGNSTIDLTNVSFDSNAQPAWDATNDYISRDSVIQYTTSQPWTVELVMNPGSNDAPGYWNGLFGYTLSLGGYWMFHSGNGTLTWYEYSSQLMYTSINLGDEIPWDSNTHLAFVYDGASNYKVYVNNVLRFDSNRTFYAGYSGGFRYIGGIASEGRYGRNYIPYFKNYNRALTASEIKSNFNAIKGRFNI